MKKWFECQGGRISRQENVGSEAAPPGGGRERAGLVSCCFFLGEKKLPLQIYGGREMPRPAVWQLAALGWQLAGLRQYMARRRFQG
jgi:hypothetical protein